MTWQSKAVLRLVIDAVGRTDRQFRIDEKSDKIYPFDDSEHGVSFAKYADEIWGIMQELIEEKYVQLYSGGPLYQLTLQSIHSAQYRFAAFRSYLANNWFSILALIVSVLAYLRTYGIDVPLLVVRLCRRVLTQGGLQ